MRNHTRKEKETQKRIIQLYNMMVNKVNSMTPYQIAKTY